MIVRALSECTSIDEAAKILGVRTVTLKKWVNNDEALLVDSIALNEPEVFDAAQRDRIVAAAINTAQKLLQSPDDRVKATAARLILQSFPPAPPPEPPSTSESRLESALSRVLGPRKITACVSEIRIVIVGSDDGAAIEPVTVEHGALVIGGAVGPAPDTIPAPTQAQGAVRVHRSGLRIHKGEKK